MRLKALLPATLLTCSLLWANSLLPVALAQDEDEKSPREIGVELLKQGDSLADEGKTTEAEIRYQEAMEALLPGLRHLPFKHTVKRDVTPRDKIRDYLLKELEEDATPDERRAESLTLKAFGLIPDDLDYEDLRLKVYTEEVGAFYDPQTDTMHLILEPGDGRKPGLLEAILGRRPGFSKDESRTVIAHELTHALADQHYDLDRLLNAIKDDSDRQLALTALIEGEATLVMMGASSEDWTGEETAKLPAEALGSAFRFMAPLLRVAGGSSMRSAPPIIGETMLFPYLRGLVFCAHLTNDKGWSALDAAYANPPLSTEQILHPEKYGPNGDAPIDLDLGPLDPGAEWTERERGVLGELQIAILLRSHKGNDAAAGWDGDRYATFENPDGRTGIVWITTWDTEADAHEFARALGRYQARRSSEIRGDDLISERGLDVVLVQGFSPEINHQLTEIAFKAQRFEKTHAILTP